jgi:Thioredoxin
MRCSHRICSFVLQLDDQKDDQREITENMNFGAQRAMEGLKEKHRTGTNELDDPDRAPTGVPYQQIRQQKAADEHRQRIEQDRKREKLDVKVAAMKRQVAQDEQEDDSDYSDLLDDDPVLDALRRKRLEEFRQQQIQRVQDLARGHGQYRTISQDEFLPECTGSSAYVAVHFFHQEFERCKILDHHLKIIATLHTTCKFLRLDSEKTPFFVAKLQVRMLPTVIVFRHGKAVDRLVGFQGLSKDPKDSDTWETRDLQTWLAGTGAIEYAPTTDEVREDLERMGKLPKGSIYRGSVSEYDENT